MFDTATNTKGAFRYNGKRTHFIIAPKKSSSPAYSLHLRHSLLSYDANNILISNNMAQAHSLRHMSRTRTPDQSIFESLLQRPMDLVADILDGGLVANDERLAEVGLFSFSERISARQAAIRG